MKLAPASLLMMVLLTTAACSKSAPAEVSLTNDLKVGAPLPVGKGGVADDGVKPLPLKPIAKTGVPDDSVKPVVPLQKAGRTGTNDDSVKPAPVSPTPR